MAGWRPPLLCCRMSDIRALLTGGCSTVVKTRSTGMLPVLHDPEYVVNLGNSGNLIHEGRAATLAPTLLSL